MPKQIKVTDELYEELKERAGGRPIPQLLRELISSVNTKSKLDEIVERRSEESAYRIAGMKGLDVPPPENDWRDDFEETDLSDWEMGVCPRCCVDFLVTQNPEEACEHWVQGYRTMKTGKKQLDWKNTAVNRFIWESYFDKVKEKYSDSQY